MRDTTGHQPRPGPTKGYAIGISDYVHGGRVEGGVRRLRAWVAGNGFAKPANHRIPESAENPVFARVSLSTRQLRFMDLNRQNTRV
jgi:hypothetical protein